MTSAYNEFIEFLAGGMTAQEMVDWRPSGAASAAFESLIRKEKTAGLRPEERAELDQIMELERVLSLVKARARARLSQTQR